MQHDVDLTSNSLNSCPETHDDGDLLAYPDSPMTHPPRTVIVRTGDLHDITTPRTKNSRYRKRLFSIDFSTICTEREETSLGEEEDLSWKPGFLILRLHCKGKDCFWIWTQSSLSCKDGHRVGQIRVEDYLR